MPNLYGADFIGRIDPKCDRDSKVLIFNLIQLEDHIKIDNRLLHELETAMLRLDKFCGKHRIVIKMSSPAFLRNELQNILASLT